MKSEKLQKILANLGITSRRQAEKLISMGKIKINEKIAKLGDRATEQDKIYLDNRLIKREPKKETKILIYHKPIGEICSRHDPKHEKTVFDHLPPLKNERWIAIGRLDINSSGLLLFTNNGEWANQMMHPSSEMEREYKVRILGELTQKQIQQLKKGIPLEDGMAKFKKIEFLNGAGKNKWYQVILTEGKNREVRRLFESQHISVSRLIRVRFGDFVLPKELAPGEFKSFQKFPPSSQIMK